MSERDKIDMKSGEHREAADPSREEQLSLLLTITMEVAAASDLSSALDVVLRRVCKKTGWVLWTGLGANQDGTVLECGPVCFCCGEGGLTKFRVASEGSHFRPGVGLPGRVWKLKRPAWIEDVTQDPNFPRTKAAAKVGLKAAVGIPILSGDEVIAVIEFFVQESRAKNERLVNVIAAVAAQLGLVMERKRAEEKLSSTNEILQSILSSMGDAVIVADNEGKFLAFNPAAERNVWRRRGPNCVKRMVASVRSLFTGQGYSFSAGSIAADRSIRGEEVNNVEIFVRHDKAPQGLWTRINGRPLRGSNGELSGGVIVCRDITEIKKEEFFLSIKAAFWK